MPAATQMGMVEAFGRFGLPTNPLTDRGILGRGAAGPLPR